MKYTPWFDPEKEPPVHVGWYQIEFDNWIRKEMRKHWNGEHWSYAVYINDSYQHVAYSKTVFGEQTGFKYRGLVRPHPDHKESNTK